MTDTMMALGPFRFSVDTAAYQEARLSTKWRWPAQERIGRRPALQYVGRDTDRLNLKGTIYPHYKGGLEQMATLRAEADKGLPLDVADGDGDVLGKWVIARIRETTGPFFKAGVPRKIEFSISLQYYGEDA